MVAVSDPLLRLAQALGFELLMYTPADSYWHALPILIVHNAIFLVTLAVWLFAFSRLTPGTARTAGAVVGALAFFVEPFWYGRSGLRIIDFGMPAYAMLGSLHTYDVFFLRPVEEVHSWSFARTVCQIFAFVDEDSTSTNPRWENFKVLGLCFAKYLSVNALLYAAPPPHIWAQIKPWSGAYIGYSTVVGFCILGTLGFFIEAVLRGIGLLFGIEMAALFNNPCGASNIRDFWARWNLAVKDGLSRVIFHGKAPPRRVVPQNGKTSGVSTSSQGAATAASLLRRRLAKTDHLSDTDASGTESHPASPELKPKKLVALKIEKGKGRKKSSFAKKAIAAFGTFIASGLFHEYMNYLGFGNGGKRPWETVSFFAINGLGTIIYTLVAKTGAFKHCPPALGNIATLVFAFGFSPFFTAPFIRAGFFEEFKSFGMLGPVHGFIWLFGDGYGGHGRS